MAKAQFPEVTATLTRGLHLLQHLYSLPELTQTFFLALDRFLMPEASAFRTEVGQVQRRLLEEAQLVLAQAAARLNASSA